MYCGKMKTTQQNQKKANSLTRDNDAEIEENNRYRQGRSRKQWESNYILQHAIFVTLLGLCFLALAKLFFETII
tara:strand:- start:2806 stop:3027 length:222 start_codon:yes stop_codon:yes gene_type:complete